MSDTPAAPAHKLPFDEKARKRAFLFLFLTVLLNLMGMGIIMPMLPPLLEKLLNINTSEAASYGKYLVLVYAAMQFFMSPILGGLSDKFGRRPVILISQLGYAVDFALMAWAPSYAWLFLARMLSGMFAATFATANAYIADVFEPEKRTQYYGMMGAAFGLGFIIGPLFGGGLSKLHLISPFATEFLETYSLRLPYAAASFLVCLTTLMGYFYLPESLTKENRRAFNWRRANPMGSLWQMRKYPLMLGVLLTFFLIQFGHNSLPATWSFYPRLVFGWNEFYVGLSLAYVGFTAAIVQGGLAGRFVKKFGERFAVIFALSITTVAFIGYAFFAKTGLSIYLWITFGAIAGVAGPAMQSIMTRAAPADAQGELQGAIASIMALSMMTSPYIMLEVFHVFSAPDANPYFPGAPFLLSAFVTAFALITFLVTMRVVNLRPKEDVKDVPKMAMDDQATETPPV